eukprot:10653436-Alexandrium_andersonii.AAC.1
MGQDNEHAITQPERNRNAETQLERTPQMQEHRRRNAETPRRRTHRTLEGRNAETPKCRTRNAEC